MAFICRMPQAGVSRDFGYHFFSAAEPAVAVGDEVAVLVAVCISGGDARHNLSITELNSPVITILAGGLPLPPYLNVDDDSLTEYDPENDAIDFYESLENPEERNGRRDQDEIRFWADYTTPEKAGFISDSRLGSLSGLGRPLSTGRSARLMNPAARAMRITIF